MPDALATLELLRAAPFAPETWPAALEALALRSGGWGGQIIAVRGTTVAFNASGGISEDAMTRFLEMGGADPDINPRTREVFSQPLHAVITETDFRLSGDLSRNAFYNECLGEVDAPFVTLALADRRPDLQVSAAFVRSARQGAATEDQKQVVREVLPHLQAAVRLTLHLEQEMAAIALGVLDRSGSPALVLDFRGQVAQASPAAEALLRAGDLVRVTAGRITASEPACDVQLQAAIQRVQSSEPDRPIQVKAALSSPGGERRAVATVSALPLGRHRFGAYARVLVTFRLPSPPADPDLLAALGLTPAETQVALLLARQTSLRAAADQRGVSVETIRAQVKSIHAKLGVSTRAELVSRLLDLAL